MKKTKPPTPIDVEKLHAVITDEQIKELLRLRGSMLKERMGMSLLLQMERYLDAPPNGGVDVIHQGEVTGKREPTPGETFRIRQALDAFDPSDFKSITKAQSNQSIADNVRDDANLDPDALSRATGGGADDE